MGTPFNPATDARRKVDTFLADILRGDTPGWPQEWRGRDVEDAFVARILFHGIAGLLADGVDLGDWPAQVCAEVRHQAQAQAMWEMEHHAFLTRLLAAFDQDAVDTCLMKGTAAAYVHYARPHLRSRGDTDLLVDRANVARVRTILASLGLVALDGIASDLDIAFQETWQYPSQHGFLHLLDLHWQALNSAALTGILPVGECLAGRVPMESGPDGACFLGPVRHLLHTCLHRGMHRSAPYFVDGLRYDDADRLIWANDIKLAAAALTPAEWDELTTLCAERGVAEACAESLVFATRTLSARVPDAALRALTSASREANSDFLLRQKRAGRAWRNFAAIAWSNKPAYLRRQLLPAAELMRARYPQDRHLPLIVSYARRVAELVTRSRRAP